MTIKRYLEETPIIGERVFVDDSAVIIGDVNIGDDSSVWPITTVRGDVNKIRIGRRSNIQDGSVLHVTHPHPSMPNGYGLMIGNNVTVGHKVILHGCTVGDDCLIGMGSIVMDGAVLHQNVFLGAGSLVPPGKVLESGYLWLGSPVKRIRLLKDSELEWIEYSAKHYVELKDKHLAGSR